MLNIQVDTKDLNRLQSGVNLLTEKNMRYAISRALNTSATYSRDTLRNVTPQYVDRPTPYTLNSTYSTQANPNKTSVEIGFKQDAFKGNPAGRYLNPMAKGGDRPNTRFEGVLRAGGIIKRSSFITPTKAFRGNAYGNVPSGTLTMVLSQLKSFTNDRRYMNASNSKASIRKRNTAGQFFLSNSRQSILYRKPDGSRTDVEVAFIVLNDNPNYERTFPIKQIMETAFNKKYKDSLINEFNNELIRLKLR